MRTARLTFAVAALLALPACTGGFSAVVQSMREVLPKSASTDSAALDPRLEYIRVTRGKQVAMLWRGSVEQAPAGRIDVYYSGLGEVIRVQNGRIVGALGLTTEWRGAEVSAPSWTAAAGAAEASRVVRTRDVMPGYISGLTEELALRRIAAPSSTALRAVAPESLTWFEERVTQSAGSGSNVLPPARYAVDLSSAGGTVVYAEQCLATDLCFSWQRWSAALQQAATR
ncbi:MAG TPA: hypothetical protein VHP37_03340 [Burkholderiales bacterium]|nr:hypothetical protein [Burkholderiales bacterium]